MNTMFLRILLILFISVNSVYAQLDSDYFITQTKDTVFCTDLKYGLSTWGALNYLRYNQLDGSPIIYKSKKSAPLVLTLYIDGKTIDRIPLKPNSKREILYTERTIDGPLRVYLKHQNTSSTSDATVMYIYYIRMPDGKFYKINDKKNMKTVIIPYVKSCPKFLETYSGDYSNKEEAFLDMIRLYNSLCPSSE